MSLLFIDHLSPKEIREIERRMRDRKFSKSRFLEDRESLALRIRADAAVLEELGVTHKQISDRLDAIVQEAGRLRDVLRATPEHKRRMTEYIERALWGDSRDISCSQTEMEAVTVEERFRVTEIRWMGFQHCPFEYDFNRTSIRSCGSGSRDIQIRNIVNGMSIWFSELLIHLIRDHQFFEGEGLRYRLDPRALIETLELQAEAQNRDSL